MSFLKLYAISAVVFFAVDFVWLTRLARPFYRQHLGHLLAETPILWAAGLFYLIYIAGIVVFAVLPGLEAKSLGGTLARGAFLGLFAYATFDLTALALLEGFPVRVAVVDLIWGTVLTGTVSAAAYGAARWLGIA